MTDMTTAQALGALRRELIAQDIPDCVADEIVLHAGRERVSNESGAAFSVSDRYIRTPRGER